MEKKPTGVEWFEYQLKDNLGNIVINQNWQLLEDLIQQAKEMEKQNTIDFATKYDDYCHKSFVNNRNQSIKSAEEFYNETFKSE